ncbi:MAG TPA: sensor histidine kinase [Clostridiales bacterium]|nr:sensor histidine kinase [Clostridiales bacterium]
MYGISDKIILIFCSAAYYLFYSDSYLAIIPILIVIALSSLFTYYDNKKFQLFACLSFAAICLFMPSYIVFLPALLYDLCLTHYQLIVISLPILLFINNKLINLETMFFVIGITILVYLIKYKTAKLIKLQKEYNDLRDNSVEISLQLEAKNKDLLLNQDAQINLATLNERNRISKEIHDNIGHLLSRSIIQIGALLIVAKDEVITKGLTSLKESLSEGMDQVRNSIHKMYDESIDLYSQLDMIVKEFTACQISFDYDIKTPPALPVKHGLIAIVKESLANVIRHSNASKVVILLREHPAIYQLIIQDNGSLMDDQKKHLTAAIESKTFGTGMGLNNIVERVKGFDGNINFYFDNGFKIFITIPK